MSPYIEESAFDAFLAMLGRTLAPGSELAYDFKTSSPDTPSTRPHECTSPI